MAGSGVTLYALTSSGNKAVIGTIDWREDVYMPSQINDNVSQIMADIRAMANAVATGWIEIGDGDGTYTATYVSATSFRFDGVNVASYYRAGMRVRVVAPTPGTIDGTIVSSTFSTHTTLVVAWDSGSLSNEAITSVSLGIGSGNTATGARLLATLTASTSASLQFTLGNTALYSAYMCVLADVMPQTDNAALIFRGSADNGASYDSTNTYYWAHEDRTFETVPTVSSQGLAATNAVFLTGGIDNAAGLVSGVAHIVPGGYRTAVSSDLVLLLASGATFYSSDSRGIWQGGIANAFAFAMNTGNILMGTIRIYGIPKV